MATNRMAKPINLQLGWPSKSLFPAAAIHEASSRALLDPDVAGEALIYGPDAGYQPLRESLATWLTEFYEPSAGPVKADNIFIANGASAALGIILQKFTDPLYTRRIFVIEPTYFLACSIFEDAGFEGMLRGVPEDEEGIDIDFVEKQLEEAQRELQRETSDVQEQKSKSESKYPKLYRYIIYAVPTFANPSGKVMSLRRRKELVQLARRYDALLVTDDVYDMLRWPVDLDAPASELPPPPPRLVDIDRQMPQQTEFGNAVSNGSFSKIVGPGVRVSWVEGTSKFVSTLATHGSTRSGGSPGHMASVFMDGMLRTKSLNRHMAEVLIPTYRKRYAAMINAIDKELVPLGSQVTTGQAYEHNADAKFSNVREAGGFFTYITLPDDVQPAEKIAKISLDFYSLKVAHGAMMVAAGDSGCLERAKTTFGRGVRLSWAWHEVPEIREGIARLAQVIRDTRDGTVDSRERIRDNDGLDLT